MKESAEQDRLVVEELGKYRLASPSPDLRDRILRAARQAMTTKDSEFDEIPGTGPVLRFAACVAIAIILIFAGNRVGHVDAAQWQHLPAPLDRRVPETDALAESANCSILAKLAAAEAVRPDEITLQNFLNLQP
jgi:hypothetical protein